MLHYLTEIGEYLFTLPERDDPENPGTPVVPPNTTTVDRPSDDHVWFIGGAWLTDAEKNPPPPMGTLIERAKAAKRNLLNAARLQANSGTFTFAGKEFSCDGLGRSDIDGMNGYVALMGALPEAWLGCWKAADNSLLPIPDVTTWKAFYTAMLVQGQNNFLKSQLLKARLDSARTLEEVEAIHW